MAGGDTGAVSAAGGDSGVRILYCMRAAVGTCTYSSSEAYSNPDAYSHSNAYAYSYPYTAAYRHARTSSSPSTYSNPDTNAVGVIYIKSSSSYIPFNFATNAYPNAGASGIHIYSILG